jgi:uncharacterized protein (TIGR02996 family)
MSDADALLAAIRAAPDDDAPRLIYADWLDEHGQSERAEFIRLQVLLARGGYIDPDRIDDFIGHFVREDELQAIFYESISGLATPSRPLAYERGFAVSFRGLFSSRAPDPAGCWTILMFGSDGFGLDDNSMRKIVSPEPPRKLFEMARLYVRQQDWETELRQAWLDGALTEQQHDAELAAPPPERDDDEMFSTPDYILREIDLRFYEQVSCVVSNSTFTFDPFALTPVIRFDGAGYRLTSDNDQVHLGPIDIARCGTPTPGFTSFPET